MGKNFIKAICIGVIAFITAPTMGQFTKGMRMVGNSIFAGSFNSGESAVNYPSNTNLNFNTSTRKYNFSLQPALGWFINDRTVAGAAFNLQISGNRESDVSGNGNTFRKNVTDGYNLGVGGFVRNYFFAQEKLPLFGQAGLNLGFSNQQNSGFSFSDNPLTRIDVDGRSTGGFYANLTLSSGLTFMLANNVGMDITIGYNFAYNKYSYTNNYDYDIGNNGSIDATAKAETVTRYTGNGVVAGIGLQVFLDPKK